MMTAAIPAIVHEFMTAPPFSSAPERSKLAVWCDDHSTINDTLPKNVTDQFESIYDCSVHEPGAVHRPACGGPQLVMVAEHP
jgi:hypothetical protein